MLDRQTDFTHLAKSIQQISSRRKNVANVLLIRYVGRGDVASCAVITSTSHRETFQWLVMIYQPQTFLLHSVFLDKNGSKEVRLNAINGREDGAKLIESMAKVVRFFDGIMDTGMLTMNIPL